MADEAAGLPQELTALGFDEARVLRLEPDDIVVLTTSKQVSTADADEMRDRMGALPEGHRVIVLDNGLSLEVLRPTQVAPAQIQLDYKADSTGLMDEMRRHIRMRGYGGSS